MFVKMKPCFISRVTATATNINFKCPFKYSIYRKQMFHTLILLFCFFKVESVYRLYFLIMPNILKFDIIKTLSSILIARKATIFPYCRIICILLDYHFRILVTLRSDFHIICTSTRKAGSNSNFLIL